MQSSKRYHPALVTMHWLIALLVFVNLTTTAQATDAQQLDRNSLIITLVRGKGDWMLSDLTALG